MDYVFQSTDHKGNHLAVTLYKDDMRSKDLIPDTNDGQVEINVGVWMALEAFPNRSNSSIS